MWPGINKGKNISRWPDFYTPPHREGKWLLLVWNHGRKERIEKGDKKKENK
jgi:hypothetical protein